MGINVEIKSPLLLKREIPKRKVGGKQFNSVTTERMVKEREGPHSHINPSYVGAAIKSQIKLHPGPFGIWVHSQL
jgi:hypothetical protein